MRVRILAVCAAATVSLAFAGTPARAQDAPARSQWAPSGSVMATAFSSGVIVSALESLFDLDADLSGRSWDIGVARGKPGHGYFRVVYKEVRFADGSWTDDGSVLNSTVGVKARGVAVEKVWRIGPSRWPVAPMLMVGGGAGKLSGEITQVERLWRFVEVTPGRWEHRQEMLPPRSAPARELLGGYEWIPFLNVAAGVTGTLAKRATVTVSVKGFDFPGTYAVGVQVVYWPRR